MAKLHSWIDLSTHDDRLRLLAMQMSQGKQVLLLLGGEHFPDAVKELGFLKSSQGFYYRADANIAKSSVAVMRKHFPNLSIKEMEASDITVKPQRAREIMDALANKGKPEEEITTSEALDEEELLQTDYMPLSQLGGAEVKVPRNLEVSTQRALSNVEIAFGDVDEHVASLMGKTIAELEGFLDAEQVDAVGLALHAFDRDRGFILGDATGLGKGRTISSVVLVSLLQGQRVVFMTEKANLISDIYRDLKAINALDKVNMLTLNPQVKVTDQEGDVVYSVTGKEVNKIARDRKIPESYNFVASTYSQVRTVTPATELSDPANRIELLEDYARGALLVLDEADVASGSTSNTHFNINRLINVAGNVLFSSATSIRDPKSVALFNRAFPTGLGSRVIARTLSEQGQAAQEALSEQLVADGVMVVREHDYSGMTVDMVEDIERVARNEELADKLSEILSAMHFLSGDVAKIVDQRNKGLLKKLGQVESDRAERAGRKYSSRNVKVRHGKLASSYTHFGSRLYNLNRQFLLGLSVDLAVEMAKEAMAEDKKPILVLDKTMGSLLEYALRKEDDSKSEADSLFDSLFEDSEDLLPSYRDILTRTLEASCYVREVKRGKPTYVNSAEDNAHIRLARDGIQDLIDKFPDMEVTPIDAMVSALGEAGYKGGEVTGRTLQVTEDELGLKRIVKRPLPDRNHLLRQFNNASSADGGLDYLIINKAAASGSSMHAGEQVKDQRPRTMIFLQTPDTANSMKQFLGRTWRKDLVAGQTPEYKVISSGLPIETYYNASMDRKLREMSSCTTSNRENAMVSDAPDLFNKYGNKIVKDYLLDNDDIAEKLNIEVASDDDAYDPANYVRLTLSRLQLMNIADQKTVLKEIQRLFYQGLDELAMVGINPLKTSHYKWGAKEESSRILRGKERPSDTVFDEPIKIKEISYEETIYPLKSLEVIKMIEVGIGSIKKDKRLGSDPTLEIISQHLEENTVSIASQLLRRDQLNLNDALTSDIETPAKRAHRNLLMLQSMLMDLAPGKIINLSNHIGEGVAGVVTHIGYSGWGLDNKADKLSSGDFFGGARESAQFAHLSNYTLSVAIPGDSRAYSYSLSTLSKDKHFAITGNRFNELSADLFDSIQNGQRTVNRTLLEGNIYQAAQMAQLDGSVITYTDENKQSRRGVLLKYDFSDDYLNSLPQPMREVSELLDIVTTTALTKEVQVMRKQKREFYPTVFFNNGESIGKGKGIKATARYYEKEGKVIYTLDLPKYKVKDSTKYNRHDEVMQYLTNEIKRLKHVHVGIDDLVTAVTYATTKTKGHIKTDDPAIFKQALTLIQNKGETFFVTARDYLKHEQRFAATESELNNDADQQVSAEQQLKPGARLSA